MKKIILSLIFFLFLNLTVFSQDIMDVTVLSEAAHSTNYLSKLFAIDLLGDIADENYRNFFILALNNEKDSWIRYYSALALSNLKMDNQIIFELTKMLTDKENDFWLRRKIAEILYDKTKKRYPMRNEKDAIVIFEPAKKEK